MEAWYDFSALLWYGFTDADWYDFVDYQIGESAYVDAIGFYCTGGTTSVFQTGAEKTDAR